MEGRLKFLADILAEWNEIDKNRSVPVVIL